MEVFIFFISKMGILSPRSQRNMQKQCEEHNLVDEAQRFPRDRQKHLQFKRTRTKIVVFYLDLRTCFRLTSAPKLPWKFLRDRHFKFPSIRNRPTITRSVSAWILRNFNGQRLNKVDSSAKIKKARQGPDRLGLFLEPADRTSIFIFDQVQQTPGHLLICI